MLLTNEKLIKGKIVMCVIVCKLEIKYFLDRV